LNVGELCSLRRSRIGEHELGVAIVWHLLTTDMDGFLSLVVCKYEISWSLHKEKFNLMVILDSFYLTVLFDGLLNDFTWQFYLTVLNNDFIWQFYMIVLFDGYTWQLYMKILYDNFIWWCYMMVLLDSFIWWFFNMIFYYGLVLWFCIMVLHYSLT
jgi:hypothetical protein